MLQKWSIFEKQEMKQAIAKWTVERTFSLLFEVIFHNISLEIR